MPILSQFGIDLINANTNEAIDNEIQRFISHAKNQNENIIVSLIIFCGFPRTRTYNNNNNNNNDSTPFTPNISYCLKRLAEALTKQQQQPKQLLLFQNFREFFLTDFILLENATTKNVQHLIQIIKYFVTSSNNNEFQSVVLQGTNLSTLALLQLTEITTVLYNAKASSNTIVGAARTVPKLRLLDCPWIETQSTSLPVCVSSHSFPNQNIKLNIVSHNEGLIGLEQAQQLNEMLIQPLVIQNNNNMNNFLLSKANRQYLAMQLLQLEFSNLTISMAALEYLIHTCLQDTPFKSIINLYRCKMQYSSSPPLVNDADDNQNDGNNTTTITSALIESPQIFGFQWENRENDNGIRNALSLPINPFDPDTAGTLRSVMTILSNHSPFTSVTKLVVECSGLGDFVLTKIAPQVCHTNLQCLDLSDTGVTDETLPNLVPVLQESSPIFATKLISIDLSGNEMITCNGIMKSLIQDVLEPGENMTLRHVFLNEPTIPTPSLSQSTTRTAEISQNSNAIEKLNYYLALNRLGRKYLLKSLDVFPSALFPLVVKKATSVDGPSVVYWVLRTFPHYFCCSQSP